MKKQYLPVIVFKSGEEHSAKAYSNYSKYIGDRFFWNLDEAQDAIRQAKEKFSTDEDYAIIDSYIKVREVTEWERL